MIRGPLARSNANRQPIIRTHRAKHLRMNVPSMSTIQDRLPTTGKSTSCLQTRVVPATPRPTSNLVGNTQSKRQISNWQTWATWLARGNLVSDPNRVVNIHTCVELAAIPQRYSGTHRAKKINDPSKIFT